MKTERSLRDRWIQRLLIAIPVALFALVPLLLVSLLSGPEGSSVVARVEIVQHLAGTQEGKLEFLLVRGVGGQGPADRFVITLDRGYTAGLGDVVRPADVFTVEGTLMDRETYFGPQYLFFGYPQLYVSQVKSGLFWPSQTSDLAALYASPLSSWEALYAVVALPFAEEFTTRSWLVTLARALSVVGLVAVAVRWRGQPVRVAEAVAGYLLVAMLLATPGIAG